MAQVTIFLPPLPLLSLHAIAAVVGPLLHCAATLVAHAALLLRYPGPLHQTESFEQATTFVGAWGGVPVVHGSGIYRTLTSILEGMRIELVVSRINRGLV